MAKMCPVTNENVLYLDCLECDDKVCLNNISRKENDAMKRYHVTICHGCNEFTILKTNDRQEAIHEARREMENKYNESVEIRMYVEDIEKEDCSNFDYDIIPMKPKRYAVRDREAGNVIDLCDSLSEAMLLIETYESNDMDEGNYSENFYEIYDYDDEVSLDGKGNYKDFI